jgi:tRNA dimethylallyltransferase
MSGKKPKVTIIAGPTSSGKTSLAINIAKEKDGEVISADSRQTYIGLDLSTGKVTREEANGIPHHLIDIRHPNDALTLHDWRGLAIAAIEDILSRDKHPIIAGGTGFYLTALIQNSTLPDVPANPQLRDQLRQLPIGVLQQKLKALDPERLAAIDKKNPVRLIRAIEVATALGKVPPIERQESPYDFELITLLPDRDILRQSITARLQARLDAGMVDEIKRVHDDMGVSWERLEELGLEMRYVALHLQSKLTYEDMVSQLDTAIWQYAKRQYTWIQNQLIADAE